MTVPIPDHLRRIRPYVPGKPIEEAERQLGIGDFVKLASNENPLGPSPLAVAAIREASTAAHRYPDGSGHDLRQALAAKLGVDSSCILLGNGSTELVEIVAKALLVGGRGAVVAERTFIMYRIAVLAMNAPLKLIPLRDHRHDLEAMAASCDHDTALVYVGNPNNPTGTYVARDAMAQYFDRVPPHVLTVVDEAYFDYVREPDYPDCLEFLRSGKNILVLRTFSKIHGLAGMRIGYGMTSEEVAGAMEAVRSPFNTSIVAQAAAIAALQDTDHVHRSRTENAREAGFMQGELRRRRFDFVPTVANFFLLRSGIPGQELHDRLLQLGVIVRPLEPFGYPDAVRVSIGTHDENRRFLEALERCLSAGERSAPRSA